MVSACGNYQHVNAVFQSYSSGDASSAAIVAFSGKPYYSVDQIVWQIQTQWGGDREGHFYKWSGSSVDYSLPGTTPFGEHNEESGFQPMAQVQLDLARE